MVFEVTSLDYWTVGSSFMNAVFGLNNLREGKDLSNDMKGGFYNVRTLLREKQPQEVFSRYIDAFSEVRDSLEFDDRLVKLLGKRDLEVLDESEIDLTIEAFKSLANHYILACQGC